MITTLGANLRRCRLDAGLTQEQLAARLGMKRTTPVSLWERSTTIPEPRTIVRLAEALRCTPADLLHNVITPLDMVRGYTVVPPVELAQASTALNAEMQRWLELGQQAGDTLRRAIAAMLVEIINERSAVARVGASDGRLRKQRPARRAAHDGAAPPAPSRSSL